MQLAGSQVQDISCPSEGFGFVVWGLGFKLKALVGLGKRGCDSSFPGLRKVLGHELTVVAVL